MVNTPFEAPEVDEHEELYRDSIATVDKSGKRIWLNPKKPVANGYWLTKRQLVSIILLLVFFVTPFIKLKGQPFFLVNLLESKFILFGQPFFPQDFVLLAIGLIIFFVFIILFTVIFGRLWCGWTCPQTVFMEMVFRRIEYWIEGDANQQRKLSAMPWNAEKLQKRGFKLFVFLLVSLLISHTVMAYIIGIDEVLAVVTKSPAENWSGFVGLVGFTGIFFFVFTYLREQVCIAICPYGRLQGVLLDKNTMVVAYDEVRGEKRAVMKDRKNTSQSFGDCVDCKLCVQVCPTGIDIRNGTQLECINCTACIDACDTVMEKVHLPKGLIRFDSLEGIKNKVPFKFTKRILAYSVVLLVLLSVEVVLFMNRSEVGVTVTRVPGMIYQKTQDGGFTNVYNINLLNKTFDHKNLTVRLLNTNKGKVQVTGSVLSLEPLDTNDGVLVITLPKEEVHGLKNELRIGFFDGEELIKEYKTNFLGPGPGVKN